MKTQRMQSPKVNHLIWENLTCPFKYEEMHSKLYTDELVLGEDLQTASVVPRESCKSSRDFL